MAADRDAADSSPAITELLEALAEARKSGEWRTAEEVATQLRELRPSDAYAVQQLALAKYKSKQPDAVTALREARSILESLDPRSTRDPETIGLWAAIHKRLWESMSEPSNLDEAITSYRRAFEIKRDHYSGINLALLLDLRAEKATPEQAAEDHHRADEARRMVIVICQELLDSGIKGEDESAIRDETFWVRATLVEALVGIGDEERARAIESELLHDPPEKWMADAVVSQLSQVRQLVERRRAP